MKNRCYLFLQYLLSQHFVSLIAGKIAFCRITWLKNWLIKKFVKHYKVNMEEAIMSSPENYLDFNSFFIRELKPNARPIIATKNDIISPVDGYITQIGKIKNDVLIQAKGKNYTLQQLLVLPEVEIKFCNGNFATFYLSPRDYHRIHMPLDGELQKMIYIPGTLFAVNNNSTSNVNNLFGRNERVVVIFDTIIGAIALILVGAMIVGSISTTWNGIIIPKNRVKDRYRKDGVNINDKEKQADKVLQIWSYMNANIMLQRGEEMGRFQLGSTVILLLPPNTSQWLDTLKLRNPVKMGQVIGNKTLSNTAIF